MNWERRVEIAIKYAYAFGCAVVVWFVTATIQIWLPFVAAAKVFREKLEDLL